MNEPMRREKVDVYIPPDRVFVDPLREEPKPGDLLLLYCTHTDWEAKFPWVTPQAIARFDRRQTTRPDRRKGSRRSPAFGRRFSDKAGECNTGNRRTKFDRRGPGVPPRVPDDEVVTSERHQVRPVGTKTWCDPEEFCGLVGRTARFARAEPSFEVRYKEAQ